MRAKVNNQCIIVDDEKSVSGSVNLYYATFEFSEDWEGFTKTVVFKSYQSQAIAMLIGSDNTCKIPAEAIRKKGYLLVGVYGVKALNEDESIRKPTVWSEPIRIEGGCSNGTVVPDPDPTIYEQILAELSRIETPTWDDLQNKPFESLGDNLELKENALFVKTTNNAEADNTLPITSAGTYVIVGNINSILQTI